MENVTYFEGKLVSPSTLDGWTQCLYCSNQKFSSISAFLKHLKHYHCTQEGGSFVCNYGYNGVCSSLPLEGVSDCDYEDHVVKHHAFAVIAKGSSAHRALSKSNDDKWNIYSSCQNLPSVLNDPRRGMKRDFFIRTWGDGFIEIKNIPPHVAVPEVTAKHFELYLRKLKKREKLLAKYANYEANKEVYSNNTDFEPKYSENILNGQATVPSLFLESSFNLEDSDTFYTVFSHISKEKISPKNSVAVHERLFYFLESVELDMSSQVSRKASAFFDMMTHLNIQMEQLKINCLAVNNLRVVISKMKEESVLLPTHLLLLTHREQNILSTYRKLEIMSTIKEVQSTIQVMLARQEFTACLDLISTTQDLLHTELSTIRCLKHFSSELNEHEKLIEKMVYADFLKYISEDLNRPVDDLHPLLEEDRLLATVFAVLRVQKFEFLDSLKEEIYATIKAVVKQTGAEAVSELEVDHETSAVADQACALSLLSWLNLLAAVTGFLRITLGRVKVICDMMKQAVEATAGQGRPKSEGVQAASLVVMNNYGSCEPILGEVACSKALSGLQEVLCSACDFAHDRCAKMLHARARNKGLDKMTVSEFLRLSKIIEKFVEDTEVICGRISTSFRMGLQSQASKFVQQFHKEREQRLNINTTNERWKAVTPPADFQKLLDYINSTGMLQKNIVFYNLLDLLIKVSLSGFTKGILAFPNDNQLFEQNSDIASKEKLEVVLNSKTCHKNMQLQNISDMGVLVNGEEYVIVGVCVLVVRLIVEYSERAATLRLAAHQLLNCLSDLLRKFNSHTCRCGVLAADIFVMKSSAKTNLKKCMVIDLSNEYSEHCKAIENKIVDVMKDSFEKQLSSWEAKSPVPSAAFNGILTAISKLHEAINDVLSQQQVQYLFDKVTHCLKERIAIHIIRLSVSPVGPQSWVVTSELTFYFKHLSELKISNRTSQEEFINGLWPAR